MKNTIKFFLVAVLFCSTVFANGDMGNGGKTCTTNCLVENQQEEPTSADKTEETTTEADDSILDFIQKYLELIFD